ncbi:ATP/GTP-binding protein [Streptomyces sp. NPDC058954]|uniref:ATP/GTP-binding protein n=1 Tax=Streptomyces sp. NPDC058954 TaxID=3346677 RepID=UPI0036D1BAF9
MLRRTAAAAVLALAALVAFTPVASAQSTGDGGGSGVGTPGCKGATLYVQVCAQDHHHAPGGRGGTGRKATTSGSGSSGSAAVQCTYTKLDPQPPAENLAMQDGKRQGGKGAVYQVYCPATARIGVVWVSDGGQAPAQPVVDPEAVARQAVDSMKLTGPDVASPRPAGHYVVGMPMWMWVNQGPTTYGPNTASATAGGVTVTATARVSSVSWTMGDGGTPVVCHGPGTRYQPSMGLADSPDCGYRYTRSSSSRPGHRYTVTATSTWTITWQVQNGAAADAGQWTETRTTTQTAAIGEAQTVTS